MSPRDISVLKAINKHIHNIRQYCNGCNDLKSFVDNNMLVEACVFNLMQIGELAKKGLSDECKEQISSIPWKLLYGMRNRIVHGYEGVQLAVVWDVIVNDLPVLSSEIEKALLK